MFYNMTKVCLILLLSALVAVQCAVDSPPENKSISYPPPEPPKPSPTPTTIAAPPKPSPTSTTTAKPPTTEPLKTTTAKPPATEPPKTTTAKPSAPDTTTSKTTTIPTPTTPKPPTPKPTQPPLPPKPVDPETGMWNVTSTTSSKFCLVDKFALQIQVPYKLTNKTLIQPINVPINATGNGTCGNNTQTITLTWKEHVADNVSQSICLNFAKNDATHKYSLQQIDVHLTPDHDVFPGLNENPKFSEPITNVTVAVGREAILACLVEDLGAYKVAWLRVDTQTILTIHSHVITKNHRIGVTHSEHRTWYLHIREVRESDRGWYMCQINTDPMKSQVGYLDIVVPPDILDYPTSTDMVVREGLNVNLRCVAKGSPEPVITWRREGGEPIIRSANGEDVLSVEDPILNISRVSRQQMGPYLCIASNGIPPSVSKRIMLIVHFAPMIWIQNQLVGAYEGQQIILECHSEAFPRSINYWTRDKGEIVPQSGKYEPMTLESSYKIHMKLTIRSVTTSDYGTYKCVSKNSLGETEGNIKLYPIPKPSTSYKSKGASRKGKYRKKQNDVSSSSTSEENSDIEDQPDSLLLEEEYYSVAKHVKSKLILTFILIALPFFLQ